MTKCETCGSQTGDLFEVVKGGVSRTFDSFECAIEAMARPCENCGCLITGNDAVEGASIFCCSACQQQSLKLEKKLSKAV